MCQYVMSNVLQRTKIIEQYEATIKATGYNNGGYNQVNRQAEESLVQAKGFWNRQILT